MNHVKITKEIVEKSPGPNKAVFRSLSYKGNRLELVDVRSITSESDYTNETYRRVSLDNGITWGNWVDTYKTGDPEKDSVKLQLSNFTLLENRETKNLEIYLTRLGENDHDFWKSDAYKYTIEFF